MVKIDPLPDNSDKFAHAASAIVLHENTLNSSTNIKLDTCLSNLK